MPPSCSSTHPCTCQQCCSVSAICLPTPPTSAWTDRAANLGLMCECLVMWLEAGMPWSSSGAKKLETRDVGGVVGFWAGFELESDCALAAPNWNFSSVALMTFVG